MKLTSSNIEKTPRVMCMLLILMATLSHGLEETVYESADGKMVCTQDQTNHQNLIWISANKPSQLIVEWEPTPLEIFKIPKAVFREGNTFALLMFTGSTHFEYWQYRNTGDKWALVSTSPLRFSSGLGTAIFKSLTEFFFPNQEGAAIESFQITDIPLVPSNKDDKRLLALLNGGVFRPRGVHIDGAIWDQPLEKILKNHEARKRVQSTEPPNTSATESLPSHPQRSSTEGSAKPTSSNKTETSNLMLFIAGGVIIFGIVVLISEIKNKQKKP